MYAIIPPAPSNGISPVLLDDGLFPEETEQIDEKIVLGSCD